MALRTLTAIGALALAGCASLPSADSLEIAGQGYPAQWTYPAGRAEVLLVLEHGFARRCSHLKTTARRLADAGALVLCLDVPMAGGNPALAEALAGWLAGDLRDPQGRALPPRVVVGGLSAGAAFAARLGARLDALAPQRLAGALLLDPVATPSLGEDLQRIAQQGRRPVLALLAPPHACNAMNNVLPALRAAGIEPVMLGPAATHLDAEGEDGDWVGEQACGRALPAQSESLRAQAAAWLRALLPSR